MRDLDSLRATRAKSVHIQVGISDTLVRMPTPLPSSRLAWYALGRFWNVGGEVFDAGYFAHLELNSEGEMFVPNQPVGPASAHFTFFSEPFSLSRVQTGPLSISLDSVGSFSLFYQRHPGSDFTDPTSFAQGQCIARFRRPFTVVTEQVGDIKLATFSAELVESMPFEHCGQTHDLKDVLPYGVTQWGFGTGSTNENEATFAGSAVAVGRTELLPR